MKTMRELLKLAAKSGEECIITIREDTSKYEKIIKDHYGVAVKISKVVVHVAPQKKEC